MNSQMKPASVLMLVGGVMLMVSSFLDWFPDGTGVVLNGWDYGMLGLYQFGCGLFIAVIGTAGALGRQRAAGPGFLGLSMNQVALMLAVAALLWNFGLQFDDQVKYGIFLGWVFAAIAAAGAAMNEVGLGQPLEHDDDNDVDIDIDDVGSPRSEF